MKNGTLVAAILCLSSIPAIAAAPGDIADLVGARAAGAESEMQARGYEDAGGNNTWWNAEKRTCVKVRVSNGRYSSIDSLSASACNQSAATSAPASGNVPQSALAACSSRADAYQNARKGTSVVNGAQRAGPNWVLTMATGTYSSKCTVTGSGRVISMDPM